MTSRLAKLCLTLPGSLLLAACSSAGLLPSADDMSVSRITVQQAQADKGLLIREGMSFAEKIENKVVRWGGTIAQVHNLADSKTAVELVARPLNRFGRPIHNDRSAGRFLAVFDVFLDPEIVKSGRDMTVVGPLQHRYQGLVGQSEYTFPVVAVINNRYWSKLTPSVQHFPHWNVHHHESIWSAWPFAPPQRAKP